MPITQTDLSPAPGRVRSALAAWGRAIAASLATQHGWCLADGIWHPHPDDLDPRVPPAPSRCP